MASRSTNRALFVLCVAALAALPSAASSQDVLSVLPAPATVRLTQSLEAAARHARSLWRDVPPVNEDGTVNAYVEISRGDRRKWEFDIRANRRAIDRVMPAGIGGYPVNYGFVPQTISYDGDPFDALVLGPPLPGGRLVQGVIVGLMFMEDEKGLDSKVVLSVPGADGAPLHALTAQDQRTIAEYFRRYKEHEPKAFSKVPGWGSVADGLAQVQTAHAFFGKCRDRAGQPCQLTR